MVYDIGLKKYREHKIRVCDISKPNNYTKLFITSALILVGQVLYVI